MTAEYFLTNYLNNSAYEYERKFLASGLGVSQMEHIVKTNPAMFGSIYHDRQVNSIYLDTPYMEYYFANVSGLSRRIKPRIRLCLCIT